ncbi:MAG: ABC transporter permease [Spirochaetaceae bacterium]|jgi:osmoprotectant transport system permease protein|nr:ABC transporter permease [Spirochaetaceae bacterium]
MIEYVARYHGRLFAAFGQHLLILLVTMTVSLVLAVLLTLFLHRKGRKAERAGLRIAGAVYAVPSLALFALLIPVLGLGMRTAVFVLVLYNQFLLVRNFLAGFNAVPAPLVEAGNGMGMTWMQVVVMVKVPLSLPVIIAGIRLAVVSTIGIGTIAAVINAGGIGSILFDGLRTNNAVKIVWGAILCAVLALGANAALLRLETFARKTTGNHESSDVST